MRTLFYFTAVLILSLSLATADAADIKLPQPQKKGGPSLFEAMDRRNSPGQREFPTGDLTNEDLSTILWAASGNNRDSNKWTVPMAMGRPPYCRIYLTAKSGVYLYDWKKHSLNQIDAKDVRTEIPLQQFAKDAPAALYIVSDGKALEALNEPLTSEGGAVLAGAMSQNIYLACEGVGVGARLIYSIKRDVSSKAFKLPAQDKVLFAILLGKK